MDVRCEKCQTEYELDESRLKPGGVTVKCTNCGHMFKIRKRSSTHVGLAASRATSRAESVGGDAPVKVTDTPSGPSAERQWLVRLENGETKTCRELATLQQWIVAGVVSRESLISRTGKTWKRLGDVAELGQYFVIADEARAQRAAKQTKPASPLAATMIGVGAARASSASDGDDDNLSTGTYRARPPTPPPPPPPAAAQTAAKQSPIAMAQTEVAPSGSMPAARRPPTQPPPPPPPRVKPPSNAGRQTAAWVTNEVKASESMAAMPQGPSAGKLSVGVDEPAFAGRVRIEPGASFTTGNLRPPDDDDQVLPTSRGSRAGMWIALVSLLVIGAAAGAVYMLVFKGSPSPVAQPAVADAEVVAATDPTEAPVLDAQAAPAAAELDAARAELVAGVWPRMKSALESLAGKDDAEALAMRARLQTALAQAMEDRAGFVDKAEADKLRKEAKQIVIEAASLAQRALAASAESPSANLAMADVMRLQKKPAPAVKRYIETARGKAAGDSEVLASVALAEAQLALRDGKLADAAKALAAVDAPGDMRIKLARAQIAHAQSKTGDAKAEVDEVLATQPDNDVALAMYASLERAVVKTDPLPPEDPAPTTASTTKPAGGSTSGGGGGGGGGRADYDSLLAQAHKAAETSCARAMDLYMRALEQRPNGVEALAGMGYCHLDAKQFSSAFSKFRAALAVSSKFEPALGGIAETYQRQGNKEAAIEAWRKYLEVYPNSVKAKKQLELLGASDTPKEPAPTPEPPNEPPPAPPAPAPEPGTTE